MADTSDPPLLPIEYLAREIEAACQAGLYLLALTAALTVPDICAALRSDSGKTTRQRYIQWFEDFASATFATGNPRTSLAGAACYQFRCAVLHEGSARLPASVNADYRRLMFLPPGGMVMHMSCMEDAFVLSVPDFCREMLTVARAWATAEGHLPQVRRNAEKAVQYHPGGIPPYFVGTPVIG